jgi:hypothetical protein
MSRRNEQGSARIDSLSDGSSECIAGAAQKARHHVCRLAGLPATVELNEHHLNSCEASRKSRLGTSLGPNSIALINLAIRVLAITGAAMRRHRRRLVRGVERLTSDGIVA